MSSWRAKTFLSNTKQLNSSVRVLSQAEMLQFYITFLSAREQTNKRRVKEIVKEFSLLCRGLQGSGYSDY